MSPRPSFSELPSPTATTPPTIILFPDMSPMTTETNSAKIPSAPTIQNSPSLMESPKITPVLDPQIGTSKALITIDDPSVSEKQPKSFKDTVIEGKTGNRREIVSIEEMEEANQSSDMPIDSDTTNQIPKVKFSREIMTKLCEPWQNSLIIKLLGKSINHHTLYQRLLQDWKLEGEFELIDVDLGYYVTKFDNPRDCNQVLTGGPYKIFGHYLAVQQWKPNFRSCQAKAPTTAVWLHFARLPMDYYHESILMFLGNRVGKAIRVDRTTLMAGVGNFARVCVEIDLSKPLIPIIDFESVEPDGAITSGKLPVVYEGLHVICFGCGEYGHKKESCYRTYHSANIQDEYSDGSDGGWDSDGRYATDNG